VSHRKLRSLSPREAFEQSQQSFALQNQNYGVSNGATMVNPLGSVPNGLGNSNYSTANNQKLPHFYHHPGAAAQNSSMYQSDGESGIIS
jgi:hypothetical protein